MNDIKVRAWDRGMKKFIYPDLFGRQMPSNWREWYDLTLFTGLTDKNGVEIYEGDIVSDHVGTGVVKYSDKYAGFRVSYGDSMAKWFYDYNLRGERESIEVIGNIYETHELEESMK